MNTDNTKNLLLVTDWFEPGSNAGGPIRSVTNLAKLLGAEINLSILTGSSDLGTTTPYSGVKIGQWNRIRDYEVWYATKDQHLKGAFIRSLRRCSPTTVYLNSMFSFLGTIIPILTLAPTRNYRIVLAPRGMLKDSALNSKQFKKRLWIYFLRIFQISHKIHFHATSTDEANDLRRVFGNRQRVTTIPNIPLCPVPTLPNSSKTAGEVRLVFVGRVHPIKNLDYAIKTLKWFNGTRCQLDVIGPNEDEDYLKLCKKLAQQLPPAVTVNFFGNIAHQETCSLLATADALLLPSYGENFGHAIFEAFAQGVPAIISDQTCWRELSNKNAGWDIPLSCPQLFAQAINQVAQMDRELHQQWRIGALNYAKDFFRTNNFRTDYLNLFFDSKRLVLMS